MNKEIILQSLTESFEALKESWELNKESIVDCIFETEKYDGNVAMDMWLYILRNNSQQLKSKEAIEDLIVKVLYKFRSEYERWAGDYYVVRAMLYHIVPYMINNHELMKIIFKETINAGICDTYMDCCVPACIAGIFLFNKPESVKFLMNQLVNNEYLIDISLGELMRKTCDCVKSVYDNIDEFKKKYKVTNQIKEILLNFINTMTNKEDRAKCTIAFLSI